MESELVAKRQVGLVQRRNLQLDKSRPPLHAPAGRPRRRARPAARRRARRARPGNRVSARTRRGSAARSARVASRASRRRWVRLTAGPAGASVARATRLRGWSKVPTVAPITTWSSRVSSSSKRSTSSTVGTTSTGSREAGRFERSERLSSSARIGGPNDQLHAHATQHRSRLGARQPLKTAWFCA